LQSSGKFWTILSERKGSAFPGADPYVEWKRCTYTADYYKFGIFMDFDCDSSKRVLNEVNDKNSHIYVDSTYECMAEGKVESTNFSNGHNII
jgi:hypothetical protein